MILFVQPERDIDHAFVDYINDFFVVCSKEGIDLTHVNNNAIKVRFGTQAIFEHFERRYGYSIMGIALGTNNDSVVAILINKDRWYKITPNRKRMVLYHELMHDIFNAEHTDYKGLMYPVIDRVYGNPNILLKEELNKL